MFKHTHEPASKADAKEEKVEAGTTPALKAPTPVRPEKDVSPAALRELLEKNLKWSQIIYEQNRRINSKLFWSALGNWFRIIIFFLLLGSSVLFLSPFFRQFVDAYNVFARQAEVSEISPTSSLESVLQFLPLDTGQKEQLKTFLQ